MKWLCDSQRIWVEEEPSSVNAHSKIIENSLTLGLFDVALKHERAQKLRRIPNFEILSIAMAKSSIDDKKKVLGLLDELVVSFPNDSGLLITAANLYLQVSSFDKALAVIDALLEEERGFKKTVVEGKDFDCERRS